MWKLGGVNHRETTCEFPMGAVAYVRIVPVCSYDFADVGHLDRRGIPFGSGSHRTDKAQAFAVLNAMR